MESPSKRLAKNIISRLVSEKIFDSERANRIENKLAGDGLSAGDWRLAIERNAALLEGDSHE